MNIVSASIKFLKELAKELAKETNCKESNLVGTSNNFKYIQFSAKDDLYKLYDFLYKESNIYMDRKRDKYTYIVENYTSIKEIINKVRSNKNKRLINGK